MSLSTCLHAQNEQKTRAIEKLTMNYNIPYI